MSHHITPLFSVEGQKQQAIKELKKHPDKMAVVIELEQDRTFRVQYIYELVTIRPAKAGDEWTNAPVGWKGIIRAVVFPWELIQRIDPYEGFTAFP